MSEKITSNSELKSEGEIKESNNENKMGVMPINKLLINISIPMVLSMIVQAMYNIVDSIFVARIVDSTDVAVNNGAGTSALSALGMAFPFQMLVIAFGNGTCVGMNALLSKALGEKNDDVVKKAASNGLILQLFNSVLFLVIGILFSGILIKSQGGEGLALEYGTQYLSIVCSFSFFVYMQFVFERMLQSTGRTLFSMITQMVGAIINIVMDPILIFGLFGFPELKVAGAAIATVAGQAVAACLALFFNIKFNKEVKLEFNKIKPDYLTIKKILSVGVPTIVMQSVGSVMVFAMNKLLNSFSEAADAVFTVYFKLQSLFIMPVIGLNNGLIPILAFNYGARKRKRMIKVIKLTLAYAFAFMFIGFLLFEFVPDKLLLVFNTGDSSLLEIGTPALRIIGIHFLAAWFCIIGGTVFQALGNGVYSLIVSVARQLVVLVPVAYIMSKIGGLTAIWFSFPIAEVMSLIVTVFFLIRINKKVISKIPDGE